MIRLGSQGRRNSTQYLSRYGQIKFACGSGCPGWGGTAVSTTDVIETVKVTDRYVVAPAAYAVLYLPTSLPRRVFVAHETQSRSASIVCLNVNVLSPPWGAATECGFGLG